MLRISIADSQKQRCLIVAGTLIAPWVADLRAALEKARGGLLDRELLVKLTDLTAINQEAENTLLSLLNEGVTVHCCGVFTKHVLEQLSRRRNIGSQEAGK